MVRLLGFSREVATLTSLPLINLVLMFELFGVIKSIPRFVRKEPARVKLLVLLMPVWLFPVLTSS